MSNKKTPGGVILTDAAAQQLARERVERIQSHLNELSNISTLHQQTFDLVLQKTLGVLERLHSFEEAKAVVDNADRLAAYIVEKKLARHYEALRALLAELQIRSVPEHMEWAAKMTGQHLGLESEKKVEDA